ncbi:MAG: ribonucleoside-diphosphate reductase, adenosylcobalamin-dependent [Candidatus Colwellbacteria bacterium CG10_big_fil_rev_8_21_14_0_10_42_22]|uniref:Vitamin B12-dependent ribonucleotide reductase n=1 Tax=Candidatus Colwellbacteria bacterium CG10_big_fil_rev_8_21_14_0_10_42_22 TaxID=1974540 RepID=A0A2H0VGI6_9BACT|nr:MAG: ribonucleoside-diphosphate reductase, adenosylcobalamin-dependent [Candidatus Colwellbacteria bacterium CG10_big_fil_rev_8_21_14_0_10_42_22]
MTKQKKEQINSSYSENALKMMKKRYLAVDDKGNQETPADMLARIAKSLAGVEKKYGTSAEKIKSLEKDFLNVMVNKEFTPAGRTVTNAGAETKVVANCIVLPIEDSMEGIFQTLKEAALLQQAGAGLGFALDKLRPTMSPTKTSKGRSSGPVSFLKVYNEAFGTIKQQGRHGANMAMIGVDHPDVYDFLTSKMAEGELSNFNISVKLTDEFMKQVNETPDTQWYCEWKGEKMKPHKVLRNPNGSVKGVEPMDITAGELYEEIAKYAWRNGEPGVVFIDKVNRENPLPDLGWIYTSNPCGEQFLHAYDNCNLGSINLAAFVEKGEVNYDKLRHTTRVAVRMLDNVIDIFDFPVEKVADMANKNRRIGLGIMGFADMLYQLGVGYNTKAGYEMAEKIMSVVQEEAHKASRDLAKEKQEFPNWKMSIYAKGEKKVKMRNAALTTVAPTGSIAMMFETSSGLEPNFALAYIKQDKDGVFYHYLNRHFEEELRRRKFSKEEIENIKAEVADKGTIQHMTDLPEDLLKTFVVSMDLNGTEHIKMQAAFQKYVDNSISKTINLPNSATLEDVKQSYIDAWKMGCKSCTVYRDGSRQIQVINIGKDEKDIKKTTDNIDKLPAEVSVEISKTEVLKITPRVRPETLVGKTYKVKTGYGNLFITINNDEAGEPLEVFANLGKSGGYFQEQTEAICRLMSLALRSHVAPQYIIKHLKGIRGPMVTMTSRGTILSLPDALAKILEEHITGGEIEEFEEQVLVAAMEDSSASIGGQTDSQMKMADYGYMPGCPECGSELIMAEGCIECKSCGYSRCG